ncbi:MAG: hypothetical protein WC455_09840 [Dehalococcoidia bacterium]|jgi:hypothetical protein
MAAVKAFILDLDVDDMQPTFARFWPASPDEQGREYYNMISNCRYAAVIQLPETTPPPAVNPAIGNTRVPVIR